MSILNNSLLLGADAGGAAGYQISRSLRFNSSDSAYLSRTPASAGNRTTWSFSAWVKRSKLGAQQFIFTTGEGWGAGSGDAYLTGAAFGADDKLYVYWRNSYAPLAGSVGVYRDPSAWYHITLRVDGSTLKAYVNGTEVCSGAISGNGGINSTQIHSIGVSTSSTYFGYADFLIADAHFIDGQALTPSSFTEVSATTGQLIPKAYAGSFGTNGFWLKFSDNSAATATTLGKDYSGNSNNWTPNNLSVTAGAGNDSLVDTPVSSGTDTGLGGQVTGNYATLNPLSAGSQITLSNGNLDYSHLGNGISCRVYSTIAMSSGKWYCEHTVTTADQLHLVGIAIATDSASQYMGQTAGSYGYYAVNGQKYNNGSQTAYGATYTNGDIIGIAFDADNRTLAFYKNGVSQGTAFSSIPAGAYYFGQGNYTGTTFTGSFNFGQRPFAYTAPSGFKALCTANLPTPTIANPATVFDTKLYTSNAGSLTVSGLGFSPDFAWLKSRGTAVAHALYDTVRGAGRALKSNTTEAEQYTTDGFVSFNSDGFTLGANTSSPQPDINFTNNVARVAWCWDAGSSTVSNTAGSITSQVRANASAGFSIISFTGNETVGATLGHGLGVKPGFAIFKDRNSGTRNFIVYHQALGAGKYLLLNSTAAQGTSSSFFNNTEPSSTVFTLGNNSETNSINPMICWAWAPVAGYSSALSWTGNGSNDGPLLHCGFLPRFFIAKRTDAGNDWWMWDTARSSTGNPVDEWLSPNRSDGEYANDADFDFLSNGIKIRTNSTTVNASGGTYIGYAWAEHPFAYARAR